MEESLFVEWVAKYFPGLVVRIVSELNGTPEKPTTYLHRRMLRKSYSVTGTWESLIAKNRLVAADVVAMDSSLPLKRRGATSKASGDIPKMGMELKLNEKQLTDLDTLIEQGGTNAEIYQRLFEDTPAVIGGIYERNEGIFLEGLSTGIALIEDTENVGTGIRLNYKYIPANKFGVAKLLTDVTSKPFDYFKKVVAKAKKDNNKIIRAMLDSDTLDLICATNQAKEFYAFTQNFVGSNIPTPDNEQINIVASKRLGFTFEIVDRSIITEKNKEDTTINPWAPGAIVFICQEEVGTLTYARLAENKRRKVGVSYELVDDFILVSKFCKTEPSLSEHTKSQARVVPVINNVDQIYLMDTLTIQA
jgi:hypothetical protein